MAPVIKVMRTCGLLFCFVLWAVAAPETSTEPWLTSMSILSKNCVQNNCKYLLDVRGGEFLGHYSWRLTPNVGARGVSCDKIYPNYELKEVKTTQWVTKLEVTVPLIEGKIYFCLRRDRKKNTPFGGEWLHQGENWVLDPISDEAVQKTTEILQLTTDSTDVQKAELQETKEWADLSHDIDINNLPKNRPTRHERNDIEVLINDKYVPLSEPNDVQDYDDIQVIDNPNFSFRDKRLAVNENKFTSGGNFDNDRVRRKKREIGEANKDEVHNLVVKDVSLSRTERQIDDFSSVRAVQQTVVVEGVRIEDSNKEPKVEDGVPSVLADSAVTIRVFGEGLSPRTVIAFTNHPQEFGEPCRFILKGEYLAKEGSVTRKSALFDITAPNPVTGPKLYICTKNLKPGVTDISKDEDKYIHQGTDSFKTLATHNSLLPLWVSLILILTCLMFSALFSGLNLGLMSLDRTELKIISNTGTDQERKYARAIMPVRDHGNYLLCSILLGNVAVNSTFTILLDELTSGLFAVIFSTLSIVLLGEITPQAICSRHGLMVGAKSIVVTKAVMALTAPLAYPVSKLLDYFLGEEIGSVYNRERLKELVKLTTDVNDLDNDEVNIISGALELRKKTVAHVMTKLEDVFMLPVDAVLDFETMSEIVKSGYSRIPVYEGSRGNIVTVLFIKDLAFVDPDDNTPLRTLCQYYQNPCNFVFEDVTLDIMFKQFKDGHKGHMAFVHRINNEGEGDPFYETIGLVTLEDVIEEMIQSEIVDETDVFLDNRTKKRRNHPLNKLQDFAAFAERHENQRIHISPQLTLATFQFLSTSVDAFRPDTVSETVLRRLLRQDVIQHIKLKGKTNKDPSTFVYQQGKPVDYFVLILEGRVEVTVGRENLVFEAGPFTYFGVQALTQNIAVAESPTPSAMGSLQNITVDAMLRHTFVPDYSVRAISELFYLTVKRSLYLAAKRATLMEKGALSKGATHEQFDTEVDKHLCHASSANIPIAMISKKLLGVSTSTANNADILGSTSAMNKPPRLNIIELMQVSQNNYPSSDQIDCEKSTANPSKSDLKYLSNIAKLPYQRTANDGKHLTICWSSPQEFDKQAKSFTQDFDNQAKSFTQDFDNEGKSFTQGFDSQGKSFTQGFDSQGKSITQYFGSSKDFFSFEKKSEDDNEVCDECVRNNYWMPMSDLDISSDNLKNDSDHVKKKTTFHKDSSLITFFDLTPNDEVIDGRPLDISKDHNNAPRCSTEYEKIVIDYESLSRQERERRVETDSLVLTQLSKIIRILERMDQT